MAKPEIYRAKLAELVPPKGSFRPTTIQDAQKGIVKIEKAEALLRILNIKIDLEIAHIEKKYQRAKKAAEIINPLIQISHEKELQLKLLNEQCSQKEIAYAEIKELSHKLLVAYCSTKQRLESFIEQELGQKPKRYTSSLGGLLPISTPNKEVKYKRYIRSKEWKKKAEDAKVRAGNRCQLCNRPRSEVQLEAHHRTYERIGQELPGDITVLCRDCHQAHEKSKAERELNEKLYEPSFGICIRCGIQIPFSLNKPFCKSCFKSWNRYKNMTYEEKFCHACGISNSGSMSRPFCLDCYKKVKIIKTA